MFYGRSYQLAFHAFMNALAASCMRCNKVCRLVALILFKLLFLFEALNKAICCRMAFGGWYSMPLPRAFSRHAHEFFLTFLKIALSLLGNLARFISASSCTLCPGIATPRRARLQQRGLQHRADSDAAGCRRGPCGYRQERRYADQGRGAQACGRKAAFLPGLLRRAGGGATSGGGDPIR